MGGRVCGECAAAGGCAWLCAASKHNGVYQLLAVTWDRLLQLQVRDSALRLVLRSPVVPRATSVHRARPSVPVVRL